MNAAPPIGAPHSALRIRHSASHRLPVGKLPVELLRRMLARAPGPEVDARILLPPGVGLDCAVVDLGERLLVFKSDPITFATAEIGWYLVQVNVNDIAVMGAMPRWLLLTMLLPEDATTPELVEEISEQVFAACRDLGIAVLGGHTEITHGLSRPILVGALVGEVAHADLVTPQGVQPDDCILLTKGVPIEATAILAREFPQRLAATLNADELATAQNFLHDPGIGVLKDAQTALRAGKVTAMHDPTEGGLAAALWELAWASGLALEVDCSAVPIPPLSARICEALELDPLASIASGALLLTAPPADAAAIAQALRAAGIPCAEIGAALPGPPEVRCLTPAGHGPPTPLPYPTQDAIAALYTDNNG
jgi:hydrogenase expression/formation protein HypE